MTFYYLPVTVLWNIDKVFIILAFLFTSSHHSLMGETACIMQAYHNDPSLKTSVNISARASLVLVDNGMFTFLQLHILDLHLVFLLYC